jgi:hypothetical protein
MSALGHANRLRSIASSIRRDDPDAGYDCDKAAAELERLHALINNPHTADFVEAVKSEAAHQRERWGTEHDTGKLDADWFWLIGYLAGKAMHSEIYGKQLHHIITTAAACLNWHAHKTGASTTMRPGIAPPASSKGEEVR